MVAWVLAPYLFSFPDYDGRAILIKKPKTNLHILLLDKDSERKLRELLPSLDSPNEHIFINERKSIQDFVEESMKYLEEKEIL